MNLVAHSSKKRGGTGSRSRVSPARILSNIGLTFAIVALMLPFVLTLSVAFRPAKDVASNAIAIPTHLTFSNITDTFTKLDYGISVLNTVILVLGSTALTIVIGAMASYPLARISRPWTSAVYRSFLLGTSIPIFVLLAPLYLLIRDMGLLNTHLGVVFIYTALNLHQLLPADPPRAGGGSGPRRGGAPPQFLLDIASPASACHGDTRDLHDAEHLERPSDPIRVSSGHRKSHSDGKRVRVGGSEIGGTDCSLPSSAPRGCPPSRDIPSPSAKRR